MTELLADCPHCGLRAFMAPGAPCPTCGHVVVKRNEDVEVDHW